MKAKRKVKKRVEPKICPNCQNTFRPHCNAVIYCCNKCRLAVLHSNGRKKGKFFGLKCWTEEEDNVLRRMYPDPRNSVQKISIYLADRTPGQIGKRIRGLGIVRDYTVIGFKSRADWMSHIYKGEKNNFYGKRHTKKSRALMSELAKQTGTFRKKSKDPEFQKRRMEAWHTSVKASPNKAEKRLLGIINEVCPNQYKFVGDGSFIIDGLNPDYVNVNGQKKVIELFGKAFHHTKVCAWKLPPRRTVRGRRKAFAEFGYEMLVIWDDELKAKTRLQEIKDRIKEFNNSSHL